MVVLMGTGKGRARRVQASSSASAGMKGNLIPRADKYIEHNLNVLLIGVHGTGKTETIMQLAEKHGLKMKYLSASTLDPYTDLVGIPVPEGDNIVFKRPHDIDDAEFIFIDEMGRAHPKVMNTLLELVQFGSINGEKLPKLRMVWGAMNPPGQEYDVEELDPALLDRFDAYIDMGPKPSVQYMAEKMPEKVAQALVSWWKQHDNEKRENYISPRRLMKLGLLHQATGSVREGLPPWGNFNIKKLELLLREASKTDEDREREAEKLRKEAEAQGRIIGDPIKPEEVKGTAGWMKKNAERIRNHLSVSPNDPFVLPEAAKFIKDKGTAQTMVDYLPILDALPPKDLEAAFTGRQYAFKQKTMAAIMQAYPNLDDFKKEYPNAFANLSAPPGFILIHPKDVRNWGSA